MHAVHRKPADLQRNKRPLFSFKTVSEKKKKKKEPGFQVLYFPCMAAVLNRSFSSGNLFTKILKLIIKKILTDHTLRFEKNYLKS